MNERRCTDSLFNNTHLCRIFLGLEWMESKSLKTMGGLCPFFQFATADISPQNREIVSIYRLLSLPSYVWTMADVLWISTSIPGG